MYLKIRIQFACKFSSPPLFSTLFICSTFSTDITQTLVDKKAAFPYSMINICKSFPTFQHLKPQPSSSFLTQTRYTVVELTTIMFYKLYCYQEQCYLPECVILNWLDVLFPSYVGAQVQTSSYACQLACLEECCLAFFATSQGQF
ncbi:hypothetical protein Tsp_01752 [Trichinella spiralis]|uniref:hypothetical protein n=1 Tax=Trichinella spiralis TaxID=6334 RepID=UPI0001EFCA89|nr:hypothetical protein Tsp_01752 [Trichinella spiralis]